MTKSRTKRRHAERALQGAPQRSGLLPAPGVLLALSTLVVALIWSYWPTLKELWRDWQIDANYSVGQLVPFVALYLAWADRKALAGRLLSPTWWGLALIALAELMRVYGFVFLYQSAERYALIVTIWGLVLLICGWSIFRRLGYGLALLIFMVPLPGIVHRSIDAPLQRMATSGAVVVLELIGVTVTQEGNVITLNHETPVAVAEACSGLRMLTAFIVVAAAFAYLVHRPVWQRGVVLLSSIPIAIFCNVARLAATSILYLSASSEVAERFFHDFAGITMMPIAILLLFLELWVLQWLVEDEGRAPRRRPVAAGGSARGRPTTT